MTRLTRVAIYICDRCQEEIAPPEPGAFTSNYGSNYDGTIKHCFACCGALDREYMLAHGKITLYLSSKPNPSYTGLGTMGNQHKQLWSVGNWPNSLSFRVIGGPHRSRHNMARWRYDVWFVGPDGHLWHGYKCGDNTDICHCKRTKTIFADLIRRK